MNLFLIGKIAPLEAIDTKTSPEMKLGNELDEDLGDKRSSFSLDKDEMKDATRKKWCHSHGTKTHTIPLLLVLIATAFTFAGSWTCTYFKGASTGFTGSYYGLWTLEGTDGKCQPWDILFSGSSLDGYLWTARALSMTALILGLSLLTAMSQVVNCHFISWGVGLVLFYFFITSLAMSQKFNVWAAFFLFFYVILVLIVRLLFIHPVHRVISSGGRKCIAWLSVLNSVFTIMTLLVLNSDFCHQCSRIPDLDQDLDPCGNQCTLGHAGFTIIFGAAAWLLAGLAVFKFGVQSDEFVTEESSMLGGYHIIESRAGAKKEVVSWSKSVNYYARKMVGHPSEMNVDKEGRDREETEKENDWDEELLAKNDCKEKILEDDDGFQRRVNEKSRKAKTLFWCFRFALVTLYAGFVLLVVVLVGSRYESGAAERSPSTTFSFVTDIVCAFNASNLSAPFVTHMSPEEAKVHGMTVAHCGPCADCSNMEDIKTLVTTRHTITKAAKTCGRTAVLGSTDELDECLEDRIGFTDKCRTCWVENMKCDVESCLFTCMKTLFTGMLRSNNVVGMKGSLNHCLQCDEQRCGTPFITCSGASRRRLGIHSDIERNPNEVCRQTIDWLSYPFD